MQEIRIARGVRMSDAARAAGLTPDTFWKFEAGKRHLNHLAWGKIAKSLDCALVDLFAPIGAPIPPPGAPDRREVIYSADELALLRLWRGAREPWTIVADPLEYAWLNFVRGLDEREHRAVTLLLADPELRKRALLMVRKADGGVQRPRKKVA